MSPKRKPNGQKMSCHNNPVIVRYSEINNVSNVIIIQKANTKSSVGQHGPPTNAKVGSGVMEE
jgi:hypothetical protein